MSIIKNMVLMICTITALEADTGGSEWNGGNNGSCQDEKHSGNCDRTRMTKPVVTMSDTWYLRYL